MNKYTKLVLSIIIFLGCWNLLDLVVDIFSEGKYTFNIVSNLIIPIVIAIIIWLIDVLFKKKKN